MPFGSFLDRLRGGAGSAAKGEQHEEQADQMRDGSLESTSPRGGGAPNSIRDMSALEIRQLKNRQKAHALAAYSDLNDKYVECMHKVTFLSNFSFTPFCSEEKAAFWACYNAERGMGKQKTWGEFMEGARRSYESSEIKDLSWLDVFQVYVSELCKEDPFAGKGWTWKKAKDDLATRRTDS